MLWQVTRVHASQRPPARLQPYASESLALARLCSARVSRPSAAAYNLGPLVL